MPEKRPQVDELFGEETGTGTFNAANWAVWDVSGLRDNVL
jgi:hypothetical protein